MLKVLKNLKNSFTSVVFIVLLLFTENKEDITNNYTLVGTELTSQEQKIVNKYIGKDKTVEAGSAYILNNINKEEKENLATKLATPLLDVLTITNEETANQIKSQMTANMPEQQKVYIQDKSIKEILSIMPEEQKNEVLEKFTSKINEMSDSIKSQAAVSAVKQMYKNIGIDTDKIQNKAWYLL